MAAASTDKFTEVGNPGTATTLAAPGHSIAGTSFGVVSTSNWSTSTGVIFAVDTVTLVNGVEVRNPGTYTEWEGVVSSSTNITSAVLRYGTDQNYPAGSTTRVYIPVASSRENRLVQGISTEHNQDGTHGAVTTTSLSNSGATTLIGALTIKSYDGYINPTDTWTYVSATSFKITGVDRTAQFPVGTKIKLTQTTAKYFYVTSTSFSTDTTVNITGGTDYTLANATITSPSLSYDEEPQGFPSAGFAYAPTYANVTIGSSVLTTTFTMIGKTVFVQGKLAFGSGSSMGTNPTISLPVTAVSSLYSAGNSPIGNGTFNRNGVGNYMISFQWSTTTTASFAFLNAAVAALALGGITATAPDTWQNGDTLSFNFRYQAT